MYDKTTHSKVVADNYFWNNMSVELLWDNICRVIGNPKNYAISHIKAGIRQLKKRGLFTQEQAEICLKETLKLRKKII
jgi:hypothetical protein